LDEGKQVGEGAQTSSSGAPEELKRHLLGAAALICARTQGSACMLRSSEAATVTSLVTSQIVRRNHVVAKSGGREWPSQGCVQPWSVRDPQVLPTPVYGWFTEGFETPDPKIPGRCSTR
jgi:hypothetical protein